MANEKNAAPTTSAKDNLLDLQKQEAKHNESAAEKQRKINEAKQEAIALMGREIRQGAEYRTLTIDAALSTVLNPELTAAQSVKAKDVVKITIEVADQSALDAINTQMSGAFPNFEPYKELKITFGVNQLFLARQNPDAAILQGVAALSRFLRTEENQYLQNASQDAGTELPACLR